VARKAERRSRLGGLFRPLVNFLFGVPRSIFLPVFILVFGVSIPQTIAFGVFTTLLVVITGGIAAVESVPRDLVRCPEGPHLAAHPQRGAAMTRGLRASQAALYVAILAAWEGLPRAGVVPRLFVPG
jgi:ABC-type nitrate/sulfonate/bicarbonate transport system permease component